ncbi:MULTISPECIES: TfuA-like protein [unclassified Ensifer]|uniref:TfuA-like protein n=1 Tax=unclassified Ensifer TaxID=2633371 RepID=UPI0008135A6D|nr:MULTISPECIES: TfuA-like protein [unclassified Ensifer]OCP22440.1 antibiotic resistance protein [Ensifer sp. LC54]OCP22651.1 antibiotic resistance protein [Ensifer sp. LC384]
MKVIFAGPTLHGADLAPNPDYELRPPAKQGDFYKAIQDGANVIGLIDGVYEYVPAIWHKEILFGLAQGVHIFGAASMGALRAAECAAFGMVGVGEIYAGFVSGALEDDADVAQSHAPAEMGFLPLSEPLVNVRATISRCLHLSHITDAEHDQLQAVAKAIFFKDRTYKHLVRSSIPDSDRASAVLAALRANNVNLKLHDASQLIEVVLKSPDQRSAPQFSWTFETTSFWESVFSSA